MFSLYENIYFNDNIQLQTISIYGKDILERKVPDFARVMFYIMFLDQDHVTVK